MGQRITPGSITGSEAIPPAPEVLEEAASAIHSGRLTLAGREWTKHTQRSQDLFWGEIRGDEAFKNGKAMQFVHEILEQHTWWNVFVHYKHGVVFEARLASGHGARWAQKGMKFIGFLEPFINSEAKK